MAQTAIKPTVTVAVDLNKSDEIAKALMQAGFEFTVIKDALWQGRKEDTTATLYKSGKLVIQGPQSSRLVSWLLKRQLIPGPTIAAPEGWIGTDEAGKGDYFGPLVTAGVLVNRASAYFLFANGVRDSKNISDSAIPALARKIKDNCWWSVVAIGPKKYNQLYKRMKGVNGVLAWGHARAIENILMNTDCKLAISDQFGDEKYIENALLQLGRRIILDQRPKAEHDIAVAAASVLAREDFLKRMAELEKKFGIDFPKGSSQVIEAARLFVKRFGKEKLEEVAKLHFRTTAQVLAA